MDVYNIGMLIKDLAIVPVDVLLSEAKVFVKPRNFYISSVPFCAIEKIEW